MTPRAATFLVFFLNGAMIGTWVGTIPFVQERLDVSKGTIMDKRVGATDDIETNNLDSRQDEYLYTDNDGHVLMDLETYV